MDYILILRCSLSAECFKPVFFSVFELFTPWGIPKKIVKFCGAFLKHKLPLLSLSLKWKALAFWSEFSSIHYLTITLSCFWSWPPTRFWVLKPCWPLSSLCRFSCLLFRLSALPFCLGITQDAMFCLMLFQLTSSLWSPCLSFPLLLCFVATDDFIERFAIVWNGMFCCFAAFQRKSGILSFKSRRLMF